MLSRAFGVTNLIKTQLCFESFQRIILIGVFGGVFVFNKCYIIQNVGLD